MKKLYFLFFGAPGSGKGTQAQVLGDLLNFPVISTGDLLRQEIKAGTRFGKRIEKHLTDGALASDADVQNLLNKRLVKKDIKNGALFDGYPRRISQQKYLIHKLNVLSKYHEKTWAVLIDVSDNEVLKRLSGRRACVCGQIYHIKFKPSKKSGKCDECGKKLFVRSDDNPEVIKNRLKLYHEQNRPLLKYWADKGRLIVVNGEQSIDMVEKDLLKQLIKTGLLR
ncbi:MAG: nucleoside monophosphate kinase [bacterium]